MLRLAASVLLTVGCVGILLLHIDPEDIGSLLRGLDPVWALAAVGAYTSMALLRGTRLWLLTKRAPSLLRLVAIAGAQAVLLSILPMRAGEVSFVGLLGRERGVGLSWASKALVAVRLLDLAAVSVVFVIAVTVSADVPVAARALIPFALVGFAAPIGLLVWPAGVARLARGPVMWVVGNPLLGRLPGMTKLSGFVDRTLSVSDPLWVRRMLPAVLLLSCGVWGAASMLSYTCLRAISVDVGGAAAAYLTSVLVLSSVLPIHGIGGYGPQNAIGAGLLMTLGVAANTAIAAHLTWHTLQLFIAALIGAVGWGILTLTEMNPPEGDAQCADANGAEGGARRECDD